MLMRQILVSWLVNQSESRIASKVLQLDKLNQKKLFKKKTNK